MTRLALNLVALDLHEVTGIYKVDGVADRLPERMRYLHPSAVPAFRRIAPYVRVSDMFRSPESSLAAKAAGRGAKAPGYSGHNFGLSIDIDVDWALRPGRIVVKSGKRGLDAWMAEQGWICHRADHRRGAEDWHYNFLGTGAHRFGSSAQALEARILALHGSQFNEVAVSVEQDRLFALRLYTGDIDGQVGPLTTQARLAFCRAWNITKPSTSKYYRTLAYVTAVKNIEKA